MYTCVVYKELTTTFIVAVWICTIHRTLNSCTDCITASTYSATQQPLYAITTLIHGNSPAFTVLDGLQRPVLLCFLPRLLFIFLFMRFWKESNLHSSLPITSTIGLSNLHAHCPLYVCKDCAVNLIPSKLRHICDFNCHEIVDTKGNEPLSYLISWDGYQSVRRTPVPINLGVQTMSSSYLATVAGLEPAHNGTKIRCLTVWRYRCKSAA